MSKDTTDEMLKQEGNGSAEQQSVPVTPQRVGRKSAVTTLIVVLLLFADIAVMVMFAKKNILVSVSGFGLLVFVLGLIGVAQTKINYDNWPLVLFPVIGFFLTALPIAEIIYKGATGSTIFTQMVIVLIAASVFLIAGVLMIVMPHAKKKYMLQKCTEHVMAKCIDLDSRMHHGKHGRRSRVYAPKWEYCIGGTVYEHQEKEYTSMSVPKIGDEQEILVDPYDPQQVYRYNPGSFKFTLYMGIMSLVSGLAIALSQILA